MKKRIIAVFVSVVIVALSVMTAFPGCSVTEYPKQVNRDEFFSKMVGRYGNNFFNMYIFEDGTFQQNIDNSLLEELDLFCYSGVFKTVYQESEFCYHAEISKLNKALSVKIENNKPMLRYGEDVVFKQYDLDNYVAGFVSNDIIYIFAPGMPVSELPAGNFILNGADNNSDGKLDSYLFLNYTKNEWITQFEGRNYINNGVWVDYNSSDSTIDAYSFDYYDVNVATYDLSDNKLTQIKDLNDKPKPIYYATSESSIIVFYDNGKANVICPTDDKNIMKYYVDATDSLNRTPHKLVHYDKLPDYNTIVKGKTVNK